VRVVSPFVGGAVAARRFGWARRDPRPGSMRDAHGRLRGLGCASATYPVYRQEASARAVLCPDGSAVVSSATTDMGPGTYTSLTQIAAETLGLAIDCVRVEIGDSRLPEAPEHGGSMTLASVGPAVQAACAKARRAALARVGAPAGADLRDVMRRLGQRLEITAKAGPGDAAERFSMHAFGAVFAEVSVDAELGEVRVPRIAGAYAAGRIVNPRTARRQVIGGMVMGIGMALMEETVIDPRTGRVITGDLADDHVPVNADVRDLDVTFVAERDRHVNPLGVKGIAEIALVGVAAAIANAVYHATGRRVRELPILGDKVLAAPLTPSRPARAAVIVRPRAAAPPPPPRGGHHTRDRPAGSSRSSDR
jgi:xanthine dehydrogenase YagR molybdenum-binding subunit